MSLKTIKGKFKNGKIEFLTKPSLIQENEEVLVVFQPAQKQKKIQTLNKIKEGLNEASNLMASSQKKDWKELKDEL